MYYFHNLKHSQNVENELRQVQQTASKYLHESGLNIAAAEIGQQAILDWYESIESPIRIHDNFKLPCDQGYEISGKRWKAFSTFIPAVEIYKYFKKYGAKLFSGNPRGYLGIRQSDENINNGIRSTAESDPENFWVYHNGISVIVNSYSKRGRTFKFNGISIVNGAQTTGAIGNLDREPSKEVKIPVRFIQAYDRQILREISRNNNSQNRMLPSDFRSNDPIQRRLVEEFHQFPGSLKYLGGRRGGDSDAISRDPNLIHSDTVAQSLTAFHGRPDVAYKNKGRIWTENEAYSRIFNDLSTCRHILFVYSLHHGIVSKKQEISQKLTNGQELTANEKNALNFLSQRGSIFLAIFAIAKSIETFAGFAVADKFSLRFNRDATVAEYTSVWMPIVEIALAFSSTLNEALKKYSFTIEDVATPVEQFTELIQSTAAANRGVYEEFHATLTRS